MLPITSNGSPSATTLAVQTCETIPTVGDQSACPRQTLAAVVEGNGLDTPPDEPLKNDHRLAMPSKHFKSASQTPENERTSRRELARALPEDERTPVVMLLVVSKRKAREKPVIVGLSAKRRSNESACFLPIFFLDCAF